MDLEITFQDKQQRDFYYATQRNQCFSGGFNNGKSFAGCLKVFTLSNTFRKYKTAICREVYADLKKTTMETFFKICPDEMVESHNYQDGKTVLKNESEIYWMHLDAVNEQSLRGLEVNSVLMDQAEEIQEQIYDVMDARIGRWDNAIIPDYLLKANPDWPIGKTGKYIAPSYMMLLCNPDTQFHFIYKKYHPESLDRDENYFFVEGEWNPNLGSRESYDVAMKHSEEWVEKYIKGKWGISSAQIHRVREDSLLEYSEELMDRILRKGNLFRILDHGEASPTCCLWVAAINGVFIVYREYYSPGKVISYHRQSIHDLSKGEQYSANWADPQIFKKTGQKDGGYWTTADEYLDRNLPAPPLTWIPADNNEFATRNRINEILAGHSGILHPVTGRDNSPRIYFIKKSTKHPFGCYHAINETQSQRRKLIGYHNGTAIYGDDREDSIADHSYDCVRYFAAMHGNGKSVPPRIIRPNTFKYFQKIAMRPRGLVAGSVQ